MPNAMGWLNDELDELHRQQLLRERRRVVPLGDGWCKIDGRRLRCFASNDYLNLLSDERLKQAAREAIDGGGVGAGASALVVGRTDWHARLEERLAAFERQEGAVLFPSGYAANVGTVAALVGHGDAVFSDQTNHASLIDGCRLSRASVHIYPHNDIDALASQLQRARDFRRRLIVTDSLFSMDGDVARLPELCDLADRYEAMLLIDEAHATGVLGASGRGAAEWLNVEDRGIVRVGTLSKGVGTLGGFVTGPTNLIDWIWNRARTQVYSTALPPAVCAAACVACDIIESEPWRRESLAKLGELLRTRLQGLGLTTSSGGVGPIAAVILNDAGAALSAAAQLEERGMLVAAIRPPTVPEGTSRLRITLSCAHSEDDVERLCGALGEVLAAAIR